MGFRYELPEQESMNYLTVKEECTEFNLTGNHKTFCIPGDYDTNEFAYTTAPLSEIREGMEKNLRKKGYESRATSFTVQTPLMMKTVDGLYINIHEAAFDVYKRQVFDRVDSKIYYQDEKSVKGAVASIYQTGAMSYIEYFWYLQEFSADQVAWRSWNGGLWGYDEAEKFVLSTHTWTPDSKIIRSTWETAWTTIGLCNTLLADLESLEPASLKMTPEKMKTYIGEVRTLRAWAYYNIFEIWGGALPLNISVGTDVYKRQVLKVLP